MKAICWFLGLFFLLVYVIIGSADSCNSPVERRNQAQDAVQGLTYVKDSRTGLCFGYGAPADKKDSGLLVEVPCDQVSRLLPQ